MKILLWHVHRDWMDAFLRGDHTYIIPTDPTGPPTDDLINTTNVQVVDPPSLLHTDIDIVILQRPEELEWAQALTRRTVGTELPAVFVEHDTPAQSPATQQHPMSDNDSIPVIHVNSFNQLMWDCGRAPTLVIEPGIPDPGPLYTGALPRLGTVIETPVRGRISGTDLLPDFASTAPIDYFGSGAQQISAAQQAPDARLHSMGDVRAPLLFEQLAHRRAFLHLPRWTSLGFALFGAMLSAMPVIVLATAEAPRVVPRAAGAVSTDPSTLLAITKKLLADPHEAVSRGRIARQIGLERFSLGQFLDEWDTVLHDLAR